MVFRSRKNRPVHKKREFAPSESEDDDELVNSVSGSSPEPRPLPVLSFARVVHS